MNGWFGYFRKGGITIEPEPAERPPDIRSRGRDFIHHLPSTRSLAQQERDAGRLYLSSRKPSSAGERSSWKLRASV